MNIKQFLEKITQNWIVKVACFVIALIIYFFHSLSTLEKKVFTLPLAIEASGSLVPSVVNPKYKYIKLYVRGKPEQIASLTEKDFKVYVDVSNYTEAGNFEVPVFIDCDERTYLMEPLELVVKPDSIPIVLEEKITRYIPISPSFSGDVAYGFKKVKHSVEPGFVAVTGPKKMVESIKNIYTEGINLQDKNENFTKKVSLINYNSLIKLDKNVDVNVVVNIVPQDMVKNFQLVPVVFENLLADIEIKETNFTTNIVLEGDVLPLEKITAESIKIIADCSFINDEGDYEIPLKINLPKDVKLSLMEPNFINVSAIRKVFDNEESSSSEENNDSTLNQAPEEANEVEADFQENLTEEN